MAATKQVPFVQMKDGTRDDYLFLDGLEKEFAAALPERLLASLAGLEDSVGGYQVSRLTHSLQTATRAQEDGADDDYVVAALLHDLGDIHAPHNHAEYAATILRPYVRPEVTWVVEKHGLFQRYYFAHHLGGDRAGREKYRGHPWFDTCAHFCERWDQTSFDPAYPTRDLTHFAPLVRTVFGREPFDPEITGPAGV